MPLKFILYRLDPDPNPNPDPTKPDKKIKRPLSFDGRVVSAFDPVHHKESYKEAQAAVGKVRGAAGVGAVIEKGAERWAIDLDGAYVNGKWSDLAVKTVRRFPNAYKEVSQSGTGLHVVGRGQIRAPHKTKNADGDIELYSKGRFLALTGTDATGSWDTDYTEEINAYLAEHGMFGTPDDDADGELPWTTEPAEGAPALTDDEVLALAPKIQSMAVKLGSRASFQQLWENDIDALAKVFPAKNDRPYDYSEADSALATRLLYVTGKNCERVEALMWQSALVRPKWERQDYLRRTIGRAHRACVGYYTERPKPSHMTPAERVAAAPAGAVLVVSDFAQYFDGCTWIEDRKLVAAPDGSLLDKEQFDHSSRFGGRCFMIDDTKLSRSAWEALNSSTGYVPSSARSTCFRPEAPPLAIIEENGERLLNTYMPIHVHHEPGNVQPFLDHLAKLLPDKRDRDYLLYWLASLVQNPGVKFTWWPLIIGTQGNGKSFIGSVMTYCIGAGHVHEANAQDLANKFNSWVDRKRLVIIEEIAVRDRHDVADTLKVLVTQARIEIQRKGKDQVMGDNRANGLLFSNQADAVRKTADDRRFGVFYTAQRQKDDLARDGMNAAYFDALWAWFRSNGGAYLLDYLLKLQIPDTMDPAKGLRRAPDTSTTREVIEASRPLPEQLLLDAVAVGQLGFRGDFVSSTYVKALLTENRLSLAPNKWTGLMSACGYERHPALAEGRTNNAVQPDGKRTTLFVRRGSIRALNLRTHAEVVDCYTRAQKDDQGEAAAVFGGAAKA